MALTGPDALRSLDDALRDIRREEDDISKRLARSAEMVARLREQEGELLRQLAQVRLDPATQAELSSQLSQAELKARDMLKLHGEALSANDSRLKALDGEIAAAAGARAMLQAEAAKHAAELKALGDKVRPQLSKDAGFAAKLATAKELAAIAEESLRKMALAEGDREQKGRPYREDPLFMYLWERGYGTKNYRANVLIAFFDGKVAQLVNFADARPNFAMLNEIPLRLREHAERQQANAKAASDEVAALETAAIEAAGGRAARQALEEAADKVDAIDKQIVELQDQRDEALKGQRELAQGADPAFTGAVTELANALGREDLKLLLAEARATRTGQDDTIVQQIDDVRQRAKEEEDDTGEQKSRLKTLAARRRELEDIQYEFKKQGFDNPQSSFREDNLVGDMLNDFLRGGISAATYWDSWRHSQNWTGSSGNWGNTPRSTSPWNDFSWPDTSFSGGSSRGSGRGGPGGGWGRISIGNSSGGTSTFSRPRSGSGGSRRTGGFKTGGGF